MPSILLVSIASYLFIEKPFRFTINKKYFFTYILSTTVLLLVVSYAGNKTVGFEKIKLELFSKDESLYINHFDEVARKAKINWSKSGLINDSEILVVGDSMASDFRAALELKGIDISIISLDGTCFRDIIINEYACGLSMSELLENVSTHKIVFISSDFVKEGSINDALLLREMFSEYSASYLVNTIRMKHASDQSYKYSKLSDKNKVGRNVYQSLYTQTHNVNAILSNHSNSTALDKYSMFCSDIQKDCKLYSNNEAPFFHDELHLTIEGLEYYGDEILKFLCVKKYNYCD